MALHTKLSFFTNQFCFPITFIPVRVQLHSAINASHGIILVGITAVETLICQIITNNRGFPLILLHQSDRFPNHQGHNHCLSVHPQPYPCHIPCHLFQSGYPHRCLLSSDSNCNKDNTVRLHLQNCRIADIFPCLTPLNQIINNL